MPFNKNKLPSRTLDLVVSSRAHEMPSENLTNVNDDLNQNSSIFHINNVTQTIHLVFGFKNMNEKLSLIENATSGLNENLKPTTTKPVTSYVFSFWKDIWNNIMVVLYKLFANNPYNLVIICLSSIALFMILILLVLYCVNRKRTTAKSSIYDRFNESLFSSIRNIDFISASTSTLPSLYSESKRTVIIRQITSLNDGKVIKRVESSEKRPDSVQSSFPKNDKTTSSEKPIDELAVISQNESSKY
jgi:hypothetical protein